MSHRIFALFTGVLIAVNLLGFSSNLMAQNTVQGSITVDGMTTALTHAYFDQYRDEYTIILTDNPVAHEMIPDGIYMLSDEGKVRALEFTISGKSQQLIKRMRKALYFNPIWIRQIDIGNAVLSISKFDEEVLVGEIKTPSLNERDGHTFSYNVSFSIKIKKEPLKLTFKGNNDEPSKAYATYCKALADGNVEQFKKFIPAEKAEMIPVDQQEVLLGMEFVLETMMTNMEIQSSTITDNKAVLNITGSRGITTAEGTIKMLLEDGLWKVSEESWRMTE